MNIWPWSRIRELEAQLNDKDETWQKKLTINEYETRALRNQVDFLIREIRKTDDIIFSISQCTDWVSMRPRVAQLTDQMTARKVAESNRISSLIVGELHNTYKPPSEPKQITKSDPQNDAIRATKNWNG